MKNMPVIELIKERKSVRSYTGEPLSQEIINCINKYTRELSPPFGAAARIELISAQTDNQPTKLGTYGVISGATNFMLLICKDGFMSEVGAGYMFEQLVLYCTELGLGTCWLGGTLNRKDFLEQVTIEKDEKLTVISPVGYKKEKRRLIDSMMRAVAGSDNRKPFDSIFFKDNFDTPLDKAEAGNYLVPLEMVRLAPSASNKQPWRIIMKDGVFHFYHHVGSFSTNDIGIALCHFELTCRELGLTGRYEIMPDIPSQNGTNYVMSWVL